MSVKPGVEPGIGRFRGPRAHAEAVKIDTRPSRHTDRSPDPRGEVQSVARANR
jgi:hypothetical protein